MNPLSRKDASSSSSKPKKRPKGRKSLTVAATAKLKRAVEAKTKALRTELANYQAELEMQNEELREAQSSLEKARSWYTALFELAPVPYLILNSDHTIKELNFAAAQVLGRARQQCASSRFSLFVAPDSRNEIWNHLEDVFSGRLGDRKTASIRLTGGPEGDRDVELHSFLVRQSIDDGPACLTVCFDVTERNRSMAAVELARQQAEEAARIKAGFLSNMSHEMRTPLASILMFAQMMKKPGFSEEKKAVYLDSVIRNSHHLNHLIGDILDVAKADAGKLTVESAAADLHEIVREIITSLMPLAAGKGLELALKMSEDLPRRILTDSTRFRQIVINLVGNSIKFTDSGTVSVEVETDGAGGGRRIRIFVRDTGIGIPPQRKAHLFEQFYQVDGSTTRQRGGAGLGLFLSRKLARLMGGEVELVSTVPGRGSVFVAILPCVEC